MAEESVAGIMIAVLAYAAPRLNATVVGVIVIVVGTVNAIYRQWVRKATPI